MINTDAVHYTLNAWMQHLKGCREYAFTVLVAPQPPEQPNRYAQITLLVDQRKALLEVFDEGEQPSPHSLADRVVHELAHVQLGDLAEFVLTMLKGACDGNERSYAIMSGLFHDQIELAVHRIADSYVSLAAAHDVPGKGYA